MYPIHAMRNQNFNFITNIFGNIYFIITETLQKYIIFPYFCYCKFPYNYFQTNLLISPV